MRVSKGLTSAATSMPQQATPLGNTANARRPSRSLQAKMAGALITPTWYTPPGAAATTPEASPPRTTPNGPTRTPTHLHSPGRTPLWQRARHAALTCSRAWDRQLLEDFWHGYNEVKRLVASESFKKPGEGKRKRPSTAQNSNMHVITEWKPTTMCAAAINAYGLAPMNYSTKKVSRPHAIHLFPPALTKHFRTAIWSNSSDPASKFIKDMGRETFDSLVKAMHAAQEQALPQPQARDARMSNLQRQGVWTDLVRAPSDAEHGMDSMIIIDPHSKNPDVDIVPTGACTIQVGLNWPSATPGYLDNQPGYRGHTKHASTAYTYGLDGRMIGCLSAPRLKLLHKMYTGQDFVTDACKLLLKCKPPARSKGGATIEPRVWQPDSSVLAPLIQHLHLTTHIFATPLTTVAGLTPLNIAPDAETLPFATLPHGPFARRWNGCNLVCPPLDANLILKSFKWAIASATDASCTEATVNVMLIPCHKSANPGPLDALRSHPCCVEFGIPLDRRDCIWGSPECWWQAEPPKMESLCKGWDGISIWIVANPAGMRELTTAMPLLWPDHCRIALTMGASKMPMENERKEIMAAATQQVQASTGRAPSKAFRKAPPMQLPERKYEATSYRDSVAWAKATFPCTQPTVADPCAAVYTDGSCAGTAREPACGAGVFDPVTDTVHTIHPTTDGAPCSINRAELSGLLGALALFRTRQDLTVYTDSLCSLYQIRTMLRKPDHMKFHKHYSQLKAIREVLIKRFEAGLRTRLAKVPAHVGCYGNERADKVAKAAAKTRAPAGVTPSQPRTETSTIGWAKAKPPPTTCCTT